MMMSVVPASHRAEQAGLVRLVDRLPRPVAAVQQSTMPGALQVLGTIIWSATLRV